MPDAAPPVFQIALPLPPLRLFDYAPPAGHVPGHDDGPVLPEDADISAHAGFEDGSGAFGFALTDGVIPRQFLVLEDLVEFLSAGTEFGMLYGQRGQGSGRMPGFGDDPNTDTEADGMFTEDMLRSVACYEATLGGDRVPGCRTPQPDGTTTTSTPPTSTTTVPGFPPATETQEP